MPPPSWLTRIPIVLILVLVISTPALGAERNIAQLPGNVSLIASSGSGVCDAVSAYGGLLALGAGTTIQFWSLMFPTSPFLVGKVVLEGRVYFVQYEGAYTYVGTNDEEYVTRIYVINSGDPINPTIAGSYTSSYDPGPYGWGKYGDRFYLSNGSTISELIDVSNPAAMTQTSTANHHNAVAGFGNSLFGLNGQTLRVYNITSSPDFPPEIGNLPHTSTMYDLALSADGQTLYIAADSILVVDVSTPSVPSLVGTFGASVWSNFESIEVTGTTACASSDKDTIYILDVTTPSAPVKAGVYFSESHGHNDLTIDNSHPNYIFAARGGGVDVIDMTTPSAPDSAAYIHTGHYVYGLEVFDRPATSRTSMTEAQQPHTYIANVLGPVGEAHFFTWVTAEKDSLGLASVFGPLFGLDVVVKTDSLIEENLHLVTIGEDGLDILDVTDPNTPSREGTVPIAGGGRIVARSKTGRFLYVGGGSLNGLTIIDTNHPGGPTVVHHYYDGETIKDIKTNNIGRSLAVAHDSGTDIFSIKSNDSDPIYRYTISTDTAPEKLNITDYHLSISDYGERIYFYDIEDPSSPADLGSFYMPVFAEITALATQGYRLPGNAAASSAAADSLYLYVGASWAGLYVLNITDPANAYIAGTYDNPERISCIDLHGGRAYVGDGIGGFLVLEFNTQMVPVLISTFGAELASRGVQLHWTIEADEKIAGFDIYRGEGDESLSSSILENKLLNAERREYLDQEVKTGRSYNYRLAVVKPDGSKMWSYLVSVDIPVAANRLLPNFPNPFNPGTTISIEVADPARVTVTVYDAAGRRVAILADRIYPAGAVELSWDGRNSSGIKVGSGVYHYQVKIGKQSFRGKMVLVK